MKVSALGLGCMGMSPSSCAPTSATRCTGHRAMPELVVLPRHGGAGAGGRPALPRAPRAVRRARRRHRALGRRAAGRGRRRHLARAAEPHPRDRPRARARRRRAGRDEPRDHEGGRGRRLLLRARPVEPAGLHDRRQRRRELRRRALPEVRLHRRTTCSPPTSCCPTASSSRSSARRRRARPARRVRRLRGDARHRDARHRATSCACPSRVRTLLAAFHSTDAAGEAVSRTIAARDPAGGDRDDGPRSRSRPSRRRSRRATRPDAGAVLIVELDGPRRRWLEDSAVVEEICRECGAFELRAAETRRGARADLEAAASPSFAAMGRISPSYYVQDGVVPRTKLPEVLRRDLRARRASTGCGSRNVFHAGDGNLHPLVLYDDAVAGRGRRAPSSARPRSSTCASTRAARSPASTASASTRRARCRSSSAPTTSR